MEPLYRDGLFYDAMNAEVTRDLDFYLEEAALAGSPILELACGTGRLAIPIAAAGLDIVGVDLSESMLARARQKNAQLQLHQADCKTLDLERKFKLVILAFNSLLLFHTRAELEAVLGTVKRHLAPGGMFILDIFNPNLRLLTRGPQDLRLAFEFQDPRGSGPVQVMETSRYDAQTQINHISWSFCLNGQPEPVQETLQMRCYFPQEIDALLHYNGFLIQNKYGDFQRTSFSADAPAQIFRCTPSS